MSALVSIRARDVATGRRVLVAPGHLEPALLVEPSNRPGHTRIFTEWSTMVVPSDGLITVEEGTETI